MEIVAVGVNPGIHIAEVEAHFGIGVVHKLGIVVLDTVACVLGLEDVGIPTWEGDADFFIRDDAVAVADQVLITHI